MRLNGNDGAPPSRAPYILALAVAVLLVVMIVVGVSAFYLLENDNGSAAGKTQIAASSSSTTSSIVPTTSVRAVSSTSTTTTPSSSTSTSSTTSTLVSTTTTLASITTTLASTTTSTIFTSVYSGRGFRRMVLDITIPSPHCEQHLQSVLSKEAGIVSFSVRRRAENNTIVYNPKLISKDRLLELTAIVGGSRMLEDVEI